MATIERQIDALGGRMDNVPEPWLAGYNCARRDAAKIGADADALVEELLETIEDVLAVLPSLDRWLRDADKLCADARARRVA